MTDEVLRAALADRLAAVERRVAAACRRAGRERTSVTVVGVTKSVGPAVAAILHDLGLTDLGESRPQELWRKAAALPGTVRWHLIGHLQRNKVERTLPFVRMIHSVDSARLTEAIHREAAKGGRVADVLVEVNVSGEADKTGLPPGELPALGHMLRLCPAVNVCGLMTMAALGEPEASRPTFAALRQLRDRLADAWDTPGLRELSMGMTNDFEVAIEQGATIVRLGSCLFEGIAPG